MQKNLLLAFSLLCVASNSSASFLETMMADKARVGSCVAGLATMLGLGYGMEKTQYFSTPARQDAAHGVAGLAILFAFNNVLGNKVAALQYAVTAGVAGASYLASTDFVAEHLNKVPYLGTILSNGMKKVGTTTDKEGNNIDVMNEGRGVAKTLRFLLTGGLIRTALSHFYGI